MHGDLAFVAAFAAAWRQRGDASDADVDVAVCPPFGYLGRVAAGLGESVRYGVQDVAVEAAGAFTGEHAAEMARDLGATFAIVGHSERRALFGESDADVAGKFAAARRAGLVPILCVGETFAERQAGVAEATVLAQLEAVLGESGPDAFGRELVVAYEPVWAIGTGETATPAQAQAMHGRIRARLASLGGYRASAVRVLYGGSVNADNAADLFAQPDIDGGLVGGASLAAATFAEICGIAGRSTLVEAPK